MGLGSWWRIARTETPGLVLPFALSVFLLWLVDALWSPFPLDAPLLIYGTCMSLAGGALIGTLASLGCTLTIRWPAWLRGIFWPVACLTTAYLLAVQLGALDRLKGHYSSLAWVVFAGSGVGGALIGGLIALTQSLTRRASRTPPPWLRHLTSIVALCLAGALFYADRVMYVGLYPDAHNALRNVSILALSLALLGWSEPLRIRSLGGREAMWLVVIGSVPLGATLTVDSSVFVGFGERPWSAGLLRNARTILDLDRDGSAYVLGGGDCNDWNASIHPMAREIPDNGIDDNCIFGDAHRRAAIADTAKVPTERAPLNIVLITVDTLTYNRIGSYDARYGALGRNTMPNLEAWSKNGVIFRQAYAAGGWTSISLATLMRGVYARKLQWQSFNETTSFRLIPTNVEPVLAGGETITKIFPLAWHDPHRPLAAWLKRRGMYTHAVVDDGFSSMLSAGLGCNEGFDHYDEIDRLPAYRRTDAGTTDMAITALRKARKSKKPFFLWTHFFGPHTPNAIHPRIRRYGDGQADLYDHEVRFLDEELGRLLRSLHRYRKNTAVFITADHGEQFGKGYRSHGFDLTESMVRVPLIAQVPGWQRGSVHTPVTLIDLLPTILELTRTPGPAWLDGLSLVPLATGIARPAPRILYTDTWQYSRKGEPFTDLVAAFDGTHKVVLNRMDHSAHTYLQRHTPDVRPSTPPASEERLTRHLKAYLEETGGTLQLSP